VDHRLVRERYIDYLSHQAATLYLFLITVGDARGLSYYSDKSLEKRLSMDSSMLEQARRELVQLQLIAYQKPLYQVLALDHRREPVTGHSELMSIGQILQKAMGGGA
jgi:hypothetical protein